MTKSVLQNKIYTKETPFYAPLLEMRPLHKKGANKQVYHVVLDISHMEDPAPIGSSFGICPNNTKNRVQELLNLFCTHAETCFTHKRTQQTCTLKELLTSRLNLDRVTQNMLILVNTYAPHPVLEQLLQDRTATKEYCQNTDMEGFCKEFWKKEVPLQAFLDLMAPLLPRYYSIASSTHIFPNQVHFMIEILTYPINGKTKMGVTGAYLLESIIQETKIPIFLLENSHFVPPLDPTVPMIMIGPGTGFAPFRGFLQERIATNATGEHWIFTGARNRATDFYYQEELENYQLQKQIRLFTAFSRDQENRIYVQDLMQEKGKQLYDLIHKLGAYIYICGDAKHMAKDVQKILEKILSEHGALTAEEGRNYLKELRKGKRLLLDVY